MALKRPVGETLAVTIGELTGHRFKDVVLLQTALTHSSAVKAQTNNERLEFLGDRVLGLVIADMLFHLFPDVAEGELAPRFNALVDARTCSEIGTELGLDAFIRGAAALKAHQGGAARNYLSDAVEALIAAIYLDGGIEPARRFIEKYWEPRSRTLVQKPKNPKSELQEWLAQKGGLRPEYAIEAREGPDHEPVFTVSVTVSGFETTLATGRSRRAAEEAAAAAFLLREGVWTTDEATS